MRFLIIVIALGVPAGLGFAAIVNWRNPGVWIWRRQLPLTRRIGWMLRYWAFGAICAYVVLVLATSVGLLQGLQF